MWSRWISSLLLGYSGDIPHKMLESVPGIKCKNFHQFLNSEWVVSDCDA